MSARRKIGSYFNMTERQHVYLLPDAVEVDQVDGYEITRRRVFLTDVELVTLHRERRWALGLLVLALSISIMLPMIFVFLSMSSSMDDRGTWVILGIFGSIAIPSFLLSLWFLGPPAPVVSVFGRRTKAVIRFGFRHKKAEETYRMLTAAIADVQVAVPQRPLEVAGNP